MLSRFFKLAEHNTTVSREITAGVTTFAAMAYILAVNPAILSAAGMPKETLVTVTAISAAVATLIMAFLTNLPLALAPGMGINAFFAFSICLGMGVAWQSALGLVFVNGVIFLALSVTGVREKIVNSIPLALKVAITCGIGLFIAFIGLKNGGIIVGNQATLVGPGELGATPAALTFGGIILAGVLVARRVPGAIVISILAITFVGFFIPDGKGGTITALPDFSKWLPASPAPTFFALDFKFLLQEPLKALPIVATLLIVDMFDNIGTLIGVTKRAGLLRPDGTLPKAGPALVADSIATILSSLFGTSTVVSYIESAAGVEAGGRTGLTSVITAVLFLAALLLTPIILIIPPAATAPALVIVGVFMFREIADLDLSDFTQSMPVVVTVLTIPLTFSIAEGLALGVISYVLLAVATGRARQVNAFSYGLAAIFVLHLFHGLFF